MPKSQATRARRRYAIAQTRRWGVILVGGERIRLRSLTRLVCGGERPKQFCPIFGVRTLLEQTRLRVARIIPPARTLFAVMRAHEDFYLRDLGHVSGQRIVQPSNKGTAPPIIYSLLRIALMNPEAISGKYNAE